MKSTSLFALIAFLFVLGLFTVAFALPIRDISTDVCTDCGGDGVAICSACGGFGLCPWCGGDGITDFSDPALRICGACSGTGKCSVCGGTGHYACGVCGGTGVLEHWNYNLTGAAVVLSLIDLAVFPGLFGFGYVVTTFRLSNNDWVHDVEDMDFWFNPMFDTWLFAKDRKRWAKWTVGGTAIVTLFLGPWLFFLFSYKSVTLDTFFAGVLVTIPVTLLFSFVFYKTYTSGIQATDEPRVLEIE